LQGLHGVRHITMTYEHMHTQSVTSNPPYQNDKGVASNHSLMQCIHCSASFIISTAPPSPCSSLLSCSCALSRTMGCVNSPSTAGTGFSADRRLPKPCRGPAAAAAATAALWLALLSAAAEAEAAIVAAADDAGPDGCACVNLSTLISWSSAGDSSSTRPTTQGCTHVRSTQTSSSNPS
jgi:hypothetical protein